MLLLLLVGCDASTADPIIVDTIPDTEEAATEQDNEQESEIVIEEPVAEIPEEDVAEPVTEPVTEPEVPETEEENESSPSVEVETPITIPESYISKITSINFDLVPSSLTSVRFFNDRNRPISYSIPNDGRTFPVGAFRAYYAGDHTITIDIDSDRVIQWFESFYPLVHRIARAIGQLPYSTQTNITSIVIVRDQFNPLTLRNGQFSVGEHELRNLIQQNELFTELVTLTEPLASVDLELWDKQRQLDDFSPSNRSVETTELDLEETFWAFQYHQQSGIEETNMLSKLSNRQQTLEQEIGLITPNFLSSLSIVNDLPNHDTMNTSTNMIYSTLIKPSDPSLLVDVTYIETAKRYPTRTLYYQEGTGTFDVHIFRATFSNGHEMNFNIDTAFSISEAEQEAQTIAYMYGQVPGLLLAGMDDFVLFKGDGHPSSGRVTTFYTEVMKKLGDFVEENFMHDMAHASLDWDELNGSKQQFDIADNQTLIPHRGVLEKNEWLSAARSDDYFVSYYAKDNPEREDIAESIIQYLVLRWRPERFDIYTLQFIEESIPERIAYLDQFDWQFPE